MTIPLPLSLRLLPALPGPLLQATPLTLLSLAGPLLQALPATPLTVLSFLGPLLHQSLVYYITMYIHIV